MNRMLCFVLINSVLSNLLCVWRNQDSFNFTGHKTLKAQKPSNNGNKSQCPKILNNTKRVTQTH